MLVVVERILTATQTEQNNSQVIGSFLGAEANKSKDEHDDEDEDDSLISGSGLKLRRDPMS